ncbi:12925_t:CDS:1 [Cetraspora pellucida]|uniref:12925_t:CDS:1 n=1 Tax=Cetraspora pellucida TaxID=1433469 RepID=A0ACA9NGC8_9GLOM|nr:12925_t:CDS:1 [Cetraspora pellucida]
MNSASIDEAVAYIEAVKKKVKDRMVMLKVAKKYGWDVAVELPQTTDEKLVDYTEEIDRARQVAANKKKQKLHDTSGKSQLFRAPPYYNTSNSGERSYYNRDYDRNRPYDSRNHYYSRPYNQERESKTNDGKIQCYNCGGFGHLAFKCLSSKSYRPYTNLATTRSRGDDARSS